MAQRTSGGWAFGIASLLTLVAGCGRADVSVMTYNVAGLPEELSASHPEHNIPLMSPLLNEYDVVLVQEDFAYHAELAAAARHDHQLPPAPTAPADGAAAAPGSLASGLSRFSDYPIEHRHAERWWTCHGTMADGSDCFAPKGVSVAGHAIRIGGRTVSIDVYNLHLDAGEAPGDETARAAQIDQLIEVIARRSQRKAIIVAGDTNIGSPGHPLLVRLLVETGLEDACQALSCPEPERIDRVMYRSSELVSLAPTRWHIPDEFVDEQGVPLSDHHPVVVDFAISAMPPSPFTAGTALPAAAPVAGVPAGAPLVVAAQPE